MKYSLFFFFGIWQTCFCFAQGIEHIAEFGTNPGNLKCYVYIPEEIETPVPVVIALHGCSQNARMIARQSGWTELAEKHRFIVVFPEQKYANNGYKCFNWFFDKDIDSVNGETKSIMEMLGFVKDNYPVDNENVFAYGLSAGAIMAVSLAANFPEDFNAIAALGGGPFKAAKNPIDALKLMAKPKEKSEEELVSLLPHPSKSLPRLIVGHCDNDQVVHPLNAKQLIRQWCAHQDVSETEFITNDAFAGNTNIKRHAYIKEENPLIIFYQFAGLGHALPVDPGDLPHQGGKTGSYSKAFDFFSTYYIAKDFGLLR